MKLTTHITSLFAVALALVFFSAFPVDAATFTVTNGGDSGAGTLRQALLDANSTPGIDTINFNIGGGGVQEILAVTPLPRISEPVTIDGTSQPGYAGNPLVNIAGDGARITIDAGNTTIRGLAFGLVAIFTNGGNVIQNNYLGTDITGSHKRADGLGGITIFNSSNNLIGGTTSGARNLITHTGIRINGNSSGNTIQGNYIGLDASGTLALSNETEGICLCSTGSSFSVSNNLIGGTQAGAGNVIAAGQRDEIQVSGLANGNVIQGNLIGTNASGTAIPSGPDDGGHGIYLSGATNTLIGGSVPSARNVIAGMVDGSYRGGHGISLNLTLNTTIKGNLIGTDITGTQALPNRIGLVLFEGVRNTTIGGIAQGEANTIANNVRDGVIISTTLMTGLATTGNVIRGNSIYSNGELGIDLGNGTLVEVNPNDACDADGGLNTPNELQNYPVLASAQMSTGAIRITGTLNSKANSNFSVDFYRSTSADPSTYGEGQTYLGTTTVTTNGSCNAAFNVSVPVAGAGNFITATSTDSNGNTSEFSQLVETSAQPPPKSPFDFDGDGKTDIGIFRPSGGEWWINRSGNGQTFALQFGSSTDKIVPADFTGDGKADVAIFRPSSGEWYVLRSEDFSFFALPFGTNGDIPAPADYDADGKADFAVFRPSSSTWFISQSSGAPTRIVQFGSAGDAPVVSDYDGDGKADIGIFRQAASGAEWWIDRSTAGLLAMQFGASTDKAVQGDYTGDGKADIAIWRPSTGEWFIVRSENFSFYGFPFGTTGDIVAPGDYDGDGKFDVTVFRPSSATWFISRTTAGTQIVQFGATGDRPLPNAFVP